jgi:hypothetical protein
MLINFGSDPSHQDMDAFELVQGTRDKDVNQTSGTWDVLIVSESSGYELTLSLLSQRVWVRSSRIGRMPAPTRI